MPVYDLSGDYRSLPTAFLEESRKTLHGSLERIEHCVNQLDEADVWWRPFESHNAIGNILLHLRGNLGQWLVAAIRGVQPDRNRPAEFAERGPIPKAELLAKLRATVDEGDRLMADLSTDADLLARRTVQGFDTCVLAAIYHAVSHFEGHAQEIIWITRLRKGESYRFLWMPSTPAQVSAS